MKRILTILAILTVIVAHSVAASIPNLVRFADITSSFAAATNPSFAAQALTTATTLAGCGGGGGITKTVDDTGATWDTTPAATTVITSPFDITANPPLFTNFQIKWANCPAIEPLDDRVCDPSFTCPLVSVDNVNKRFMLGCQTSTRAFAGTGAISDGIVDFWFQGGETFTEGGIRGVDIVSNTVACFMYEDDNNLVTTCVNPNAGTVTWTDGWGTGGVDLDAPTDGQCFDVDPTNLLGCAEDSTNTRWFGGVRGVAAGAFGDAATWAGTFAGSEIPNAALISNDGGRAIIAGHDRDAVNREPLILAVGALPELDTDNGQTCILTEAGSNKDSTINEIVEESGGVLVPAIIANDGAACAISEFADADAGIAPAWVAIGEQVASLTSDCNDADVATVNNARRTAVTYNIATGDNVGIAFFSMDAATNTDADTFNGGGTEEANGVTFLNSVRDDLVGVIWGGQTNTDAFIDAGTLTGGTFGHERTVSLLDNNDASNTLLGNCETYTDQFGSNQNQFVCAWTGTGGGVAGGEGVSAAGTPEFSATTLLLAVLLAGGFIVFVVRRRRY